MSLPAEPSWPQLLSSPKPLSIFSFSQIPFSDLYEPQPHASLQAPPSVVLFTTLSRMKRSQGLWEALRVDTFLKKLKQITLKSDDSLSHTINWLKTRSHKFPPKSQLGFCVLSTQCLLRRHTLAHRNVLSIPSSHAQIGAPCP